MIMFINIVMYLFCNIPTHRGGVKMQHLILGIKAIRLPAVATGKEKIFTNPYRVGGWVKFVSKRGVSIENP